VWVLRAKACALGRQKTNLGIVFQRKYLMEEAQTPVSLFEGNIKEKYHVHFRSWQKKRLNFHFLAVALVYQSLNIKNSSARRSKLIMFDSLIKSECQKSEKVWQRKSDGMFFAGTSFGPSLFAARPREIQWTQFQPPARTPSRGQRSN
jgi:hypothetical protein